MIGGRFLLAGFPEARLTKATVRWLERLQPGGVILFERNVKDADQLVELTGAIRQLLPDALLAIDMEGGRVDRLKKVLGPAVSPAALARHSPSLALEAGRWIGHGLRLFDLDLDLAPTVDLDRGQTGNALDDRYLGGTPQAVEERARAFLRGLAEAGVGGCLKHFPGLGGAARDTHFEGARVELSAAELEVDLAPFRRLMGEVGVVMVGHAVYPAYDPEHPASLSPAILGTLLRRELGFAGLVLSDDLEMKAFLDLGAPAERAELSFARGCDALLVCHTPDLAVEIARRLEAPALEPRRREAAERLARYRDRVREDRALGGYRLADLGRRPPGLAEVRQRLREVHGAADRTA
jgi:beta-N-acetylhexosaminidase